MSKQRTVLTPAEAEAHATLLRIEAIADEAEESAKRTIDIAERAKIGANRTMIGTEKYYTQKLRAEAKHDRALEDLHKRAPGHMTMRAVEKLEHKRERDNDFRFTSTIFFLILSYIVEGPLWLDLTAWGLAVASGLYWIGMSFYTWKQTKTRVLTVLANHAFLQAEAAAERH